ncbi:Formamidopyrimidine-DNA glycosylase [Acidisarcina polymorpha]|uniref:Formamidopyrimidine-DNA glycosylase n=1 Tax=Acidisarcina polymorpha TaxID=2211140 RepID=A0A2Z5G277_9BACT|nr:DNA-formamidopyrimidine glycosylase [Acidisarcina polymorpha]AXC13211.1 Formamidopyrimidine-DNA glycosylase [Acidisarcina polymorpha]
MPELPEVETVANGVNDRVRGQRIESVWLSSKPQTFKTPAAEMEQDLAGCRIIQVRRVGKHIVFDLENGDARSGVLLQWIVHLGMTGRLLVCSPEVPLPAHTHAVLGLSSGRELRFVDPRRFGRLAIFRMENESVEPSHQSTAQGFQGPGQEPLSIALADFQKLFRGRHLPIKSALLNQKLLHGVGNIYADESLFRAGIRPKRIAGRLRKAELERLHVSIQTVLREAIKLGGSSVSDYVDADGVRGFFQLQHRVYMRTGQPCLVCGTPIRKIVLGGRSTHYCPHCQR